MKINFKKAIGLLLIIGSTLELINVFTEFKSGGIKEWPHGVEIGFILSVAAGIFFIKTSKNK